MRYYFDLDEGGCVLADTLGMECPDFQAMRAAAMKLLAEIALHTEHQSDVHRVAVVVINALRVPVFRASLNIEGERCS